MNANTIVGLFTFANLNQFTGIEHTRIASMLFVLTIVSMVMWIAVCLSMMARIGAKMLLKHPLDSHKSLQLQNTPEVPEPNVSLDEIVVQPSDADTAKSKKTHEDVLVG